jgi:hypothetical protein
LYSVGNCKRLCDFFKNINWLIFGALTSSDLNSVGDGWKNAETNCKKMCRVSARILFIYNFARGFLET